MTPSTDEHGHPSDMNALETEHATFRILSEAVFQTVLDGIMIFDADGMCTSMNPAAEILLGFRPNEAQGKHWRDFLTFIADDQVVDQDRTPISNAYYGHAFSGHAFSLRTKDGKSINVSLSVSPTLKLWRIIGVVVIFRDYTEEARIDRMKTEFISICAHQLRTPITAIRWAVESIKSMRPARNEELEMFQIMLKATSAMTQTINSILNVARIESRLLIVRPVETNVRKLTQEAVSTLRELAREKQQKLLMEWPNLTTSIRTDPVLLREILANLISNAIKYTPEGGEIRVRCYQANSNLVFEVEDNGYGIPEEQQKRVFDRFFRADNIVKVVTEGTGLGLSICKQLVELLGGTIAFRSKENVGTVFSVTIPVEGPREREGKLGLVKNPMV